MTFRRIRVVHRKTFEKKSLKGSFYARGFTGPGSRTAGKTGDE